MQFRDAQTKTLLATVLLSALSISGVLAEEKATQPAPTDTQGVNLSPEELEAIQAAAAAAELQKGKTPSTPATESKGDAASSEAQEAKTTPADTKTAPAEKQATYVRPEYRLHNQAAPARQISEKPGSAIRGD